MRRIQRMGTMASTALIAFSSLLTIGFAGVAHAAANTCVWTGATNNNFSTATNWSSCGGVAPQVGDSISFSVWAGTPDAGSTQNVTLTDDLGYALSGIAGTGASSTQRYYINNLSLADGATATSTSFAFYLNNLTSAGSITVGDQFVINSGNVHGTLSTSGGGPFVYTLTAGNVVATSGSTLYVSTPAIGASATLNFTNLTIQNGAQYHACSDATTETDITGNLTLGGGTGASPILSFAPCRGGGSDVAVSGGLNLTGAVSLLSDATINILSNRISIDGALTANGHTLSINADGTSSVMGSGSTGVLAIAKGGLLAPGHSPGCLSTGNLTVNGTYQAQLGGTAACTGYDQTVVTGTVDLTGSTLDTELYGGFVPAKGQTFEIVNNDGADPVTSTFTGLAEGATFKVGTTTFSITYKGGDGNDVVISVVTPPGTPDTGLGFIGSNPAATLGVSILTAGVILAIARRSRAATS